jgi:hypothetical protein
MSFWCLFLDPHLSTQRSITVIVTVWGPLTLEQDNSFHPGELFRRVSCLDMSLWILSGCHSPFWICFAHEYDTWANILVKQSLWNMAISLHYVLQMLHLDHKGDLQHSLLAQFPLVCGKNVRIPFKRRESCQSGNVHSGKTIPFPMREFPKCSLCDCQSDLSQISIGATNSLVKI